MRENVLFFHTLFLMYHHVSILDDSGSIDPALVDAARAKVQAELEPFQFCDRYNLDETALFHELQPNHTLASRSRPGTKSSKARLTIAILCNSDG